LRWKPSDLHREIGGVRADLELFRRGMSIKLGGMIFIAVGALLAAMRCMMHLQCSALLVLQAVL
jgi:hypothetical protein